ncbi:MAG: serine hydrolase domain-containing protein [Asticcacaulis sp.]|uniref:serine hydrolase domain-containing protein n=1 Tax=Asticcacaulis sp. TaxID=1872648 RepID=UPI0039E3529D
MRLTIKTLLLATALSTASLTGAALAQTPAVSASDARTALDRDMPQVLKDAGVPSVSIARIENGKLAFTAAYGEQSAGVPATTGTLYNVASLTKPITAEVILRMVSEGTLQLDESMSRYYTDPDIAADPRTPLLTPRLALSHQTGLPNWRDDKLTFVRNPQSGFAYSGEGYQYVARFAAKKWKTPFETLANKYVLSRFGMTDTDYTQSPDALARIALPTDASGKALAPDFATEANAADLLYTTPADYAKMVLAIVNKSDVKGVAGFDRDRIQVNTTAADCAGIDAALCPTRSGMGLGWQVFQFGEGKTAQTYMMHTGKDPGVFTFAAYNPDTKNATLIFTNSDNGAKAVLAVLERIGGDPAFVSYLRAEAAK